MGMCLNIQGKWAAFLALRPEHHWPGHVRELSSGRPAGLGCSVACRPAPSGPCFGWL